jgi:hypothetical protein
MQKRTEANSSKCARHLQQQTTGDKADSTLTSAAFRRSKRRPAADFRRVPWRHDYPPREREAALPRNGQKGHEMVRVFLGIGESTS